MLQIQLKGNNKDKAVFKEVDFKEIILGTDGPMKRAYFYLLSVSDRFLVKGV